jgi:hypothetical protein
VLNQSELKNGVVDPRDIANRSEEEMAPQAERFRSRVIGQFRSGGARIRGNDGEIYTIEPKQHPLVAQVDRDGSLAKMAVVFDVRDKNGREKSLAKFVSPSEVAASVRAETLELKPGVHLLLPKAVVQAEQAQTVRVQESIVRDLTTGGAHARRLGQAQRKLEASRGVRL